MRQDKQHFHVKLISMLGMQALEVFPLIGGQIPVSGQRGNKIKVQLFREQGLIKLLFYLPQLVRL